MKYGTFRYDTVGVENGLERVNGQFLTIALARSVKL